MDGNGVKGHRFESLGIFWKKQKRRQSSLILWAPKVWNANQDVSTQMTLVTGSDWRLSSTNLFYFIDWSIKVMVPLSLSLQFLSHLFQCWFIFVTYFLQFGLVPSALTVCWLPFLFQSISNLSETTISHSYFFKKYFKETVQRAWWQKIDIILSAFHDHFSMCKYTLDAFDIANHGSMQDANHIWTWQAAQ